MSLVIDICIGHVLKAALQPRLRRRCSQGAWGWRWSRRGRWGDRHCWLQHWSVDVSLHVDLPHALAIRPAKGIIVHALKLKSETQATSGKLVVLAFADGAWATAIDVKLGRTFVTKVHAEVGAPLPVGVQEQPLRLR